MESTNTFYPVFEPDQVLTSDHLNQLRAFLTAQDRLSRRLLHGIGIVCGLEISNPVQHTISISKGVGITSNGFLITIDESDCTYFRPYYDKIFNEECCDDQPGGKYDLFLKENETQYNLWELLTDEEEKEINDNSIKLLSDAKMKMEDMYLLLYLEIEDLDMLACFGEDCDEKGIQRHFRLRKLLILKSDLLNIIKKANDFESITEEDLKDEINARFKLRPVNIKRLGYDFSTSDQTLSLKNYHNFNTLYSNYSSVIQDGIKDVGKALYNSYVAFEPILKDLYPTNPFKNYNVENLDQSPLYIKMISALNSNRLMVQYAYDFLNDLVDAYDEFREYAFHLAVLCSPDPKWFPRHLMLGKAIQPEEKPSVFRHHFIYSPILDKQQDLLEKVKLYHQRLVKMVEEFNSHAISHKDIKLTPSSSYSEPLSERAIPFYYDVNDTGNLYKLWNFDKKKRMSSDTILSYHAENTYGKNEFVKKPGLWEYKKFDFLRVEGHVGKNYESVLANLLSQQEKLNLPIKVVGIKLSRRFTNTNVDAECRFDDLQTLYNTFITELRCMLLEEAGFFRDLDTEPSVAGSPDIAKKATESEIIAKKANNPANDIMNLLGAGKLVEKSGSKVETGDSGNTETGFEIGKLENYMYYNDKSIPELDLGFNYSNPSEGSIGYMMDNIDLSDGKDLYSSIFNIYASGQLEYMIPGIFIYTILYPVQIASNIDTLLKNIPEKLEDLDIKTLNKDYKSLVESASGFKKSIQENLKNPKYQKVGNEEVLLYRLDKLIYHCSIKKILNIYKLYLKKIREVQQLNLFSRFAKDHPGMEHMAGVPKGGTLVLVYMDTNDLAVLGKATDIQGTLASGYDLRAFGAGDYERNIENLNPSERESDTSVSNEFIRTKMPEENTGKKSLAYDSDGLKMETPGWNIKSGDKNVLDYLNQNKGKIPPEIIGRIVESLDYIPFPPDKLPPNNVVVADFALPYLCCGTCPEISTMVVSQIVFRLDDSVFCAVDTNKYEFIVEPAGGNITGPGVQPVDGGYVFQPSSIDWKQENIKLTYLINNQSIVLNLKVYKPIAAFTVSEPVADNKGRMKVVFTNNCQNTDIYSFDFGDGTKFEGSQFPIDHVYTNVKDGQKASITLIAKRDTCISPPAKQSITFKIKPTTPTSNCYSEEVLICWAENVLKRLKYDPIISALNSRKFKEKETMLENAGILLEMLRESCGFLPLDFIEDGGSLFHIESKRILLTCLLKFKIKVNYDAERNYKNDDLRRIIEEFEKKNCCTDSNKSLRLDETLLESLSNSEKKSILKTRGIAEVENKDEKALTKMIIDSKEGSNLTKNEVSILSVKNIKKILSNINIPFTDRTKKNELIKLIP